MPPARHRRDRQTSVSKTNAVRCITTRTTTQAPMLLKNLVRTGTLLAGARAFAPLSIQRRAFTKMSAAPIGVMVTVEIEEARVPAFLEALKVDAAGSREEEGCLRFDLLKDSEAANTWHFYEIYKNDEAMAVHKTLPHYKAWADFKARFAASSCWPSRLCRSSPRRGLAHEEPTRAERPRRSTPSTRPIERRPAAASSRRRWPSSRPTTSRPSLAPGARFPPSSTSSVSTGVRELLGTDLIL